MEVSVGLRLISLFAISILASCNPPGDYALVGSAYVPAAHGEIDVEKLDRQQVLVTVTLDYLVAPDRIETGLTHYLVWFVPVGEPALRQQVLEYDAETETGRASIPTTLREFEVQITAESSDAPIRPSDLLVASQKIREK